jgi:hypothetical protein
MNKITDATAKKLHLKIQWIRNGGSYGPNSEPFNADRVRELSTSEPKRRNTSGLS